MSAARQARPATPWLNVLLGTVLVLVAALDVLLLGAIGWAAWQRAVLTERDEQIRRADPIELRGAQREARELRLLIAASREAISTTLGALPTDSDVARYLADLHERARAAGVTLVELSPRATDPAAIPIRRFAIRIVGDWTLLQGFLSQVTQSCLAAARLEEVSLRREGGQAELSFELLVGVRPVGPLAPVTPGNPTGTGP